MNDEQTLAVRVSSDGMAAYIKVSPTGSEKFTVQQLENALRFSKVTFGIDYAELRSIVEEKRYFMEIQVAKGIPAEDGADGYFEYLFDFNVELKPKILKDGSVDYNNMGRVPVAEEYQELVKYHPATNFVSGKNVYGEQVVGRKGKELPTLKGDGFYLSEDKTVYTAAVAGKPEIDVYDNRLTVTKVLMVKEDVTTSTGGLEFVGDIIINGDIREGTQIHAGGNIECWGCVEAAYLSAGGNVVLRNGMQGKGKGMIVAEGDVSGKFFEQVYIQAKGKVSANSMMNCEVVSEDTVQVSGRFGMIVGGSVWAIQRIEATMIGNMAETPTSVTVGTSEKLALKLKQLNEQIEEERENIKKLETLSDKLDQTLRDNPKAGAAIAQDRMKVMRSKVERKQAICDIEKEKLNILKLMEKTSTAKIIVSRSIYPRTTLTINGETKNIRTENYNVTYRRKDGEISFVPNI